MLGGLDLRVRPSARRRSRRATRKRAATAVNRGASVRADGVARIRRAGPARGRVEARAGLYVPVVLREAKVARDASQHLLVAPMRLQEHPVEDRKSTRLNSSHVKI